MKLSDVFTRSMLIGWGIAVAVFIGIRYVFSPIWDVQVRTIIILAGIPLGAMAGGYYVGRNSARYALLQSFLIAILEMLVLWLLRMMPLNWIIAAVTLAAAPVGMIIAQRLAFSASGTIFISSRSYGSARNFYSPPPPPRKRITDPITRLLDRWRANRLYQQLLHRVRMDHEIADRLIDYERRRTPYARRETLIRNAMERLSRDNR